MPNHGQNAYDENYDEYPHRIKTTEGDQSGITKNYRHDYKNETSNEVNFGSAILKTESSRPEMEVNNDNFFHTQSIYAPPSYTDTDFGGHTAQPVTMSHYPSNQLFDSQQELGNSIGRAGGLSLMSSKKLGRLGHASKVDDSLSYGQALKDGRLLRQEDVRSNDFINLDGCLIGSQSSNSILNREKLGRVLIKTGQTPAMTITSQNTKVVRSELGGISPDFSKKPEFDNGSMSMSQKYQDMIQGDNT